MLAAAAGRRKSMTTSPYIADTHRVPLWRRLAALAYDLLAVAAVAMVTVMLCLAVTRGHLDAGAAWYRLTLLAAIAAYYLLSWVRGGRTLGMRPWHLRLCTSDGRRPGVGRALLRFAIAATPLLLLALSHTLPLRNAVLAPLAGWAVFYAVALFDPRRRALHDLLSGTEMRRA